MPSCSGKKCFSRRVMEEKQELTDYDCWDKLGRGRPPLDAMEFCCMIPYQGGRFRHGHWVHGHLGTA